MVLARLLLLAAAGGVTTLTYAAVIFHMIGPRIGWSVAAVAALVGALLGLGCGLLLGGRRR